MNLSKDLIQLALIAYFLELLFSGEHELSSGSVPPAVVGEPELNSGCGVNFAALCHSFQI